VPAVLAAFDVVFDCLVGGAADTAKEFAATPQVAAAENLAKLRKRLKQSTSANTLKQLDNAGNTHIRVETHKQVHVITHHLHFVNHKPVFPGDLPENPLTNTLNLARQNLVTILRAKHDMKTHLPESIAHAKQIHIGTSKADSKGAPLRGRRFGNTLKTEEENTMWEKIVRNSSAT